MGYVLVVDDDPAVRDVVAGALRDDGYDVRTTSEGLAALSTVEDEAPEVVVLDLRLPDIDGVTVISRLRPDYQGPILICSGIRDERARIRALDAGADDFMVKPFGVDELRARLRALQRRAPGTPERSFHAGDLDIDVAGRVLEVAGVERRLTPTQWRIVIALVEHPGQLLTYKRLAQRVYGDRTGDEARETLRAHIRTLRKTLGDSADEQRYLRTEAGVGYRWVANGDAPEDLPADDDVVHELNNVLTAMRFGTHLLRRRLGSLVETGAEVGPLAEVTDRLESLVARAARLTVDLQEKEDPTRAGGRGRRRP